MRVYSRWREEPKKMSRNEIQHAMLEELRTFLRPRIEGKKRISRKEAGKIGRG